MCIESKKIKIDILLSELKKQNLVINNRILENDFCYGVSSDSREIFSKYVFICINGDKFDGHKFAHNVVDKGVNLLIVERFLDIDVSQIIVNDIRKSTAVLAKIFFDNPTKKLKLFGITGTNGKTTTSFFAFQLIKKMNYKVGLIGTLGYWINDIYYHSERTTPDIIELNKILSEMVYNKIEIVIMEVSSHAVALNRIYGLKFDAGVFTNLTREHLDFHKNLEAYSNCKFQFLKEVEKNNGKLFINIDDETGKIFADKLNCSTISVTNGDFIIKNIIKKQNKTYFEYYVKDYIYKIESPIIGEYNVKNLASAICLAEIIKKDKNQIEEILKNIEQVPGRFELVKNSDRTIIIDYAHTEDALKNILINAKDICEGKLILVVGAGGDRDAGKRYNMGMVSSELADLVIFTNDNPRNENQYEIIKDLIKGIKNINFIIKPDRKDAINLSLDLCKKNDVVVIAGKGHEEYQEIKGGKIYFSDKDEVLNYKRSSMKDIEYGVGNQSLAVEIDSLFLEKFWETMLKRVIIKNVSTDSRKIKDNSLFFAIKGDNFDGHNFVESVLELNNTIAIISNEKYFVDGRTILVDSVMDEYLNFAKYYLNLFNVAKIAITGSYGKTTTKEILFNILNNKGLTLKNYKNENNFIGVPRTIFNLRKEHEFVIFEIGTNNIGEIPKLSKIIEPDYGILTAISDAHLKGLGNIDFIIKEKTSLLNNSKKSIYSKDSSNITWKKSISVGMNNANDIKIKIDKEEKNKIIFSLEGNTFCFTSEVKFRILNVILAVYCAKEFNISNEIIQKGISQNLDLENRMTLLKKENFIVLFDCYNASPKTMKTAIEFWRNIEIGNSHLAILGDMLELGEYEISFHKEIGKMFNKENESLWSVGYLSKYYNSDIHFSNVEEVIEFCKNYKFEEKVIILIKGSNSINLKKLKEVF